MTANSMGHVRGASYRPSGSLLHSPGMKNLNNLVGIFTKNDNEC